MSTGEQNLDLQKDALEEAMSHLREGDCLVVWKLDRLGRSLKDLIEKVEALGEEGCEFRSLQEGIDTTTSAGKLVFHIFGALAEFERDLIRERTKAGLRAARDRGKTGGRPPALEEGDIKLAQRLIQGPDVPVETICERLGISSATLYRYVGPDGSRRK